MRVYTFIILSLLFINCSQKEDAQSQKSLPSSYSAKDTMSWQGAYTGTVPSKTHVGMDIELTLNPSNTYDLHVVFLEKNPRNNKEGQYKGDIVWEEDSATFVLKELDTISNKFRIKKDLVEYLNPDGTPNTSQLAEFYVLKKKPS